MQASSCSHSCDNQVKSTTMVSADDLFLLHMARHLLSGSDTLGPIQQLPAVGTSAFKTYPAATGSEAGLAAALAAATPAFAGSLWAIFTL